MSSKLEFRRNDVRSVQGILFCILVIVVNCVDLLFLFQKVKNYHEMKKRQTVPLITKILEKIPTLNIFTHSGEIGSYSGL